ncbi:MerR family transcriptional regulator [Thermoflexus sp.]|uniref:MerR family transcriptional regulator n=1 Tax=Thermoflexus sp. TaxID=1969742 RepID=UPI0026182170|nr:helix-turn-helix domain-containing protein [Thermoflexus sp.]MCX7690342.1 helix-turn-helix domain-containing protein [Thermoflexus sp.]
MARRKKSKETSGEWLSLKAAAAMLGVHPATLRAWADAGRIPSRRTAGGHRRFARRDLEIWLQAHGTEPGVQMLIAYTLGQLRLELARGAGLQAPWFERMRGEMAQAFQATCYQLLEELQAYIRDRDPLRPQRVGARYADQAMAAGVGLGDLLRAFLHFGGYLLESVFQMVEMGSSPERWHEVYRTITAFYNETLLAMVERYLEQAPWVKGTTGFSMD